MSKAQDRKLGIVAGGGALPKALIEMCQASKRPYFVLALKGHADPKLMPKNAPVKWIRLGAVGRAFAEMKRQKVQDIVMIGGVRRPSVLELCPDLTGLRFLMRAGFRLFGDDNLLRAVIKEIESKGYRVVGIDSLMPSLLATEGTFGKVEPTKGDLADIVHGFKVAKLLGEADVGQSVIVQQGLVLALEGIEGTAELIKRTAELKRRGGGGVLVKVSKPQQERRVDLPTIGVQTVQGVFDSGFKGIAVESGSVLISEAEKTVALADKLGIFIVGVK